MSMYLSAVEAARRLGVSRTTLYAYVSRGQVRSRSKSGTRQRQYSATDVEALVQRKRARRDPSATAAQALGVQGLAVLASSLTSIDEGRLRYRGRDVPALAAALPRRFPRGGALEAVAELLWGGPMPTGAGLRPSPVGLRAPAARSMSVVQRMFTWLAAAGAADGSGYNLAPEAVRVTGARIVRGLAEAVTAGEGQETTVAGVLASSWCPQVRGARKRIDAALVLCADHELNVSAFTARCVASARATPYMVVTAALAALQGHRHGGATERCAALVDEAGAPSEVLAARLRRGDNIPGFGHPLYPDGDPRGVMLMALSRPSASTHRMRAFVDAGAAMLGDGPTLDFGLLALARSLSLPEHAPLAMFAVGRAVGWIAHALEQYAQESMIRPRARYVGPGPTDAMP